MSSPGGEGWDDDTDPAGEAPPTVRMPTSRPPRAGRFEPVPPVHGVLRDGVIWAPTPPLVPPGEVRGPSLYPGS